MIPTQRTGPDRNGTPLDTNHLPLTLTIRRPCRTKGCEGTRPMVAVGCADGWDQCSRCYRRTWVSRRQTVGAAA